VGGIGIGIGVGVGMGRTFPDPPKRPQVVTLIDGRPPASLERLRERLAEAGIELIKRKDSYENWQEAFDGAAAVLLTDEFSRRRGRRPYPERPQVPVVVWLREDEEREYYSSFYRQPESDGIDDEIIVVDDPKGPLDQIFETLRLLCTEGLELVLATPNSDSLIVLLDQWDEVFARLERDFPDIYQLDPRKFEELIAELLTRDKYRVELTQAKRDGGRDVLAYHDSSLGSHLHLFECKRYALHRRVGVPLVRSLFGVLHDENATSAVLVTTSEFTRDARQFETRNSHRLALRDHRYLQEWIKRVRAPSP